MDMLFYYENIFLFINIYIWVFIFPAVIKKIFPIHNIKMKYNVSVLFLSSYYPLTCHNLCQLTSSIIWYSLHRSVSKENSK